MVINCRGNTFTSYYNGIANMNLSDYFEVNYLPHIKQVVSSKD